MLSVRAINYAQPPEGHFWRWSADYDAIEWSDGSTLAMWQEVRTVLDFLAREGAIPPLGSVLLVLAACREEWPSGSFGRWAEEAGRAGHRIRSILEPVWQLPKELRATLTAKCHLVSTIFEGSSYSLPKKESRNILAELAVPGHRHLAGGVPRFEAEERLRLDGAALKMALARQDAESLEARLRTGIDREVIEPATLPAPAAEAPDEPRVLLDRLATAGGEIGAAAAVARRAIAMMNFPGRFGAPQDLPVGGIADITNRGTIDRLLPGELAWDDLVLAARLVHNEALYFRREIPPMNVVVSHTVLLDRGLRLWGAGRVFSLGVALGLWHHPELHKQGGTFECMAAAADDGFTHLDLGTAEGVAAALETLVPAPDPLPFLTAWWDAERIIDDAAIPDVSLVTAAEHLEEPDVRTLLGGIAGWIHGRSGRFRVLALRRDGSLEIEAWSPGGHRTLFRGQVDLEEILQPPSRKSEPSLESDAAQSLIVRPDPLAALLPIYAKARLPFLFPLVPQASAYLETGSGAVGVSVNRRVMEWPCQGWGGFELFPQVPGRQHWMGRNEHGDPVVIASAEQAGGVVRVFFLQQGKLHEIELTASRHSFPRHAAISGGAVLLGYADSVEALSLATGHRLAVLPVKAMPAAPVLHYDGDQIRVLDSGRKPGFGGEGWSFRDASWPRMLASPTHVSLVAGVLRVLIGAKTHQFDPIKLAWEETKPATVPYAAFEQSRLSPAGGVTLARAQAGHLEAWRDSRGLLHLRSMTGDETWSLLLSSPAASVWSPTYGLHSQDERLLPPAEETPAPGALRPLLAFLRSSLAPSSPP